MDDTKWEAQLARLAAHKVAHGDCNVPFCWAEGPRLGKWVANQREYKNKLDRGEASRGDDGGVDGAADGARLRLGASRESQPAGARGRGAAAVPSRGAATSGASARPRPAAAPGAGPDPGPARPGPGHAGRAERRGLADLGGKRYGSIEQQH